MVLNLLLKYYLIRPQFKVLFLWFGILAISAVREFVELPESYFGKKNLLNQIFAKWSWGWTLIFLTPYSILMSFVYSCDHWKRGVVATGLRIVITTGLWYFWASFVFGWVENLTGVCFDSELRPLLNIIDKQSCMKLEGRTRWEGFDISGHAFLLSFASLVISSELQVHRYWHMIPQNAAQHIPIGSKALNRLKSRHKMTETVAKWLFVFNCVLSLLWEFILFCTCLYFHSFFSKAIGASIGIMSWLITYSETFKHKNIQIFPGHGPLKYLLTDMSQKELQNGTTEDNKNE